MDYYLDENRTLLMKVDHDYLQEATYFLKSGATGSADKHSPEATLQIENFFEKSWVPTESLWVQSILQFTSNDIEDSKVVVTQFELKP